MIRQLAALILDTLRQAWSRKVFAGLFLNSSLTLALLVWYWRTVSAHGPYANLTLLRQSDPRFLDNLFAAKALLGSTAWFAFWTQVGFAMLLLLGLAAALLAPRANAFLLATPAPRTVILLGRFLGCLLTVLPGIVYATAGMWIVAGTEMGVWHLPFLFVIPAAMLGIAAMLAFVFLLQTACRSTALVLGGLVAVTILEFGARQPDVFRQLTGSETLASAAGHLSILLPRTPEIAKWTVALVASGTAGNVTVLWTAAVFIAVTVALAAAVFSRQEF